jgi:iron complex outermembrane recepter protein
MTTLKHLAGIFMFILFSFAALAQNQTVKGKVTDASTGSGVEGITIKLKSTGKGVLSDKDGNFILNASSNDVLQITGVGYASQSVSINGKEEITVQLVSTATQLGDVVVVGSRSGGRVKTESPVPVDVISLSQATQTTAKTDLTSLLNVMAPSFNYNKQSGGDGADAVDLATLRGLGPDQTLVLINGKRQHQTAFVALFGTRGRGNSGTDLNAIPEASIDRVEILRDGASAQYGSDAIAGVINIVLKKTVNQLTVNADYSGYYDHKYNTLNNVDPSEYYTGSQIDGNTVSLGLNYGIAVGKHNGYINFSGDFLNQGKTFREVPDTNYTTNPNALPVNTGRRAFGDASVTSGGIMINSEIPLGTSKTSFYAFGGYNYKNSNAYAYTRNFQSAPGKFPTNPDGSIVYDPSVMFTANDGTIFYDPIEDVHITDASLAFGFKGDFGNNWTWDVSNTAGGNNFHYFGEKTFNASQDTTGTIAQTNFNDGGFYLFQNTVDADFNKHYSNIASGMNLSLGSEYRYEQYGIYAGEQASYENYAPRGYLVRSNADTVQVYGGAQGFPGFQPSDEVTARRGNIAAYIEDELDVTKSWLIDGAVRAENYSDFGFISTYKFATRYKVTHNFNLRGSVSTGFRAPSLQQIDFSNTESNVEDGVLTLVKIAPNSSPITAAAGIPALKPEKSINGSLGFAWKPCKNLSITLDGYIVNVKDRVVLTGQFDASDPALTQILTQLNVNDVQFFANAVNTTNLGLDMVVDYKKHWAKNTFSVLFAGNVQNLTINKINIPTALDGNPTEQQEFFSTREQDFVKASAPPEKLNLNLEYDINKFGIGTHFTYYGKIQLLGYGYVNTYPPLVELDNGSATVPEVFNYKGKVVTDLFFAYHFSKKINLYWGADNLFNVHPSLGIVPGANASAYDGETGSGSV